MFYTYLLLSKKDLIRYVGFTENLDRRIVEHNAGFVKSTQKRKPLQLIYFEEFNTKSEAMQREKYFKSGFGRSYLNKIGK